MASLESVLTVDQVKQLVKLLVFLVRQGHGAVVIRVQGGHVRFVRLEVEQTFDQVDGGKWDDIIGL